MTAEELLIGNWGRRKQPVISHDPQQVPIGTNLAGKTVDTPQGGYVMQGAREGMVMREPVHRLPPTVATTDNALITKGQTVVPPSQPDQREIDIMVKRAKNATLADDDLRFLAQKELEMRRQPNIQDIANMGFDDRLNFAKQGFIQQRDAQMGALDEFGRQQAGLYDQRLVDSQNQMAQTREQTEAQNNELLRAFEAEQRQGAEMARGEVIEAGREGMEHLKRSAARRGMQRSSEAEGAIAKATANTQKIISQIELATNSAIRSYQVDLLDKLDKKMEKLQDRVLSLGDAKADAELGILREKQKTFIELMSQDPSNPQNMIILADKLKAQELAELKENNEAAKELRKEAQANFQFMITNFGSQAFANTSPEQLSVLASNLGLPAEALLGLPATLKEEEANWQKAKYSMDKEYDWVKTTTEQAFRERMADKDFVRDLEKLGINFENDMVKLGEQFKNTKNLKLFESAIDEAKFANLGYGNYAKSAVGVVGGGAGLFLENGSQVSPKIKNAAPVGSQKRDARNQLVGECAYEAGRMVTKPGTNQNMVYGMNLQNKKNTLATYVKNGQAFYKNNGKAVVGNSVITSESKKWGHVAVINEILPNGDYVLSEYNRAGKKEFSNSRVVKPDAPFILGVIDTKPNNKYQVAKDISKLATDVASKDPLVKAGGITLNSTSLKKIMNMIPTIAKVGEKEGVEDFARGLPDTGDLENRFAEGEIDEYGLPVDEQRRAVRTGAYTLPANTVEQLMRYNPEAYRQYMGDLAYQRDFETQTKKEEKLQEEIKKQAEKGQLPPAVLPVINKNKQVGSMIDDLQNYYRKMDRVGPEHFARIYWPWDEEAHSYEALRNAIMGPAARVIMQEVGVLTNQDIERVKKIVPTISDTREVGEFKLQQLQNLMQRSNDGLLDIYEAGGYKVDEMRSLLGGGKPQEKQTIVKQNILADLKHGYSAREIVNAMRDTEYKEVVEADLALGYSPEEIVKLYTQ